MTTALEKAVEVPRAHESDLRRFGVARGDGLWVGGQANIPYRIDGAKGIVDRKLRHGSPNIQTWTSVLMSAFTLCW